MCVRSCRPSLELLSTLTCSLQNLVVALPEAAAAKNLHQRATSWCDKVQQILQTDEVRSVQNEGADSGWMSRLATSHSGFILQRGINIVSAFLLNSFTAFVFYSCPLWHCTVVLLQLSGKLMNPTMGSLLWKPLMVYNLRHGLHSLTDTTRPETVKWVSAFDLSNSD